MKLGTIILVQGLFIVISLIYVQGKTINKPKTHIVEMINYKFNPQVLEIKKYDTVIWINTVPLKHNVKTKIKDKKRRFVSKLLRKKQRFSHSFNYKGKYEYYCVPHKGMGMAGTIIVK